MHAMISISCNMGKVEDRIREASRQPAIKDMPESRRLEAVVKAMSYIYEDLGFRNEDISATRRNVVNAANYVTIWYDHLSVKELILAFDLVNVGALDDGLPIDQNGNPDRKSYNRLGKEYISRVLNAYKMLRSRVTNCNVALIRMGDGVSDRDRAKYENESKKKTVTVYAYFRRNGKLPDWMNPITEMLTYERLAKLGLAPEYDVTDNDRQYVMSRMIASLAKSGDMGKVKAIRGYGLDHELLDNPARYKARRDALVEGLLMMVEDDIRLDDYFSVEW